MGIVHCTAILAAISITWLPASCSKNSTVAKSSSTATNSVAANPNEKNLGEITLTNHYETCVAIGDGKNCVITPRLLDGKSVRLVLSLQSKNADGETDALSVMQVVTKPGKPFEVAIGDLNLILTPVIME
jgi:hypothetical protein